MSNTSSAVARRRILESEPIGQNGQAAAGPAVQWRLHGFTRLDYAAALQAIAAGQSAAEIALAAGSKASNRANLKRVGVRIVHTLVDAGVVYETCCRLGYTLEDFCRGLIEATRAMRTVRIYHRGRVIATVEEPDNRARLAALDLYMRAVGIDKLPL